MKGLILALAIAHSADLVSTEIALKRPGARELHPWLQQRTTRVVLVSGSTLTQIGLVHTLYRRRPKLAKALAIVCIGVPTAAAVHNLR